MSPSIWTLTCVFALATFPLSGQAACPDSRIGETAQDCPWAELTRQASGKPLMPLLKQEVPEFAKMLEAEARRAGWLNFWGRSLNFDEGARSIIIADPLIDELLATFGAPARQDRVVHAGVEHTYGYLFSVLRTPFGYKRARWVKGEIERGLGLPDGIVSPRATEGGLLANVTALGASIALTDSRAWKEWVSKNPEIPTSLLVGSRADLKVQRLTEVTEGPNPIEIRTDFVEFPHASGSSNTHLLVYSIRERADSDPRLITAFPVEKSFVERAKDPAQLGSGKPIQTRYNAFVAGATGTPMKGTRSWK